MTLTPRTGERGIMTEKDGFFAELKSLPGQQDRQDQPVCRSLDPQERSALRVLEVGALELEERVQLVPQEQTVCL